MTHEKDFCESVMQCGNVLGSSTSQRIGRDGELSRAETRRLEAEEARIRASEARAKRDGKITPAERERLQKELDKASRDIYQQKHDEQERGS